MTAWNIQLTTVSIPLPPEREREYRRALRLLAGLTIKNPPEIVTDRRASVFPAREKGK